MSCAQIQITGGDKVEPMGVSFPGAYKGTYLRSDNSSDSNIHLRSATDPGIVTNIYEDATYTPPGKLRIRNCRNHWLIVRCRPCCMGMLKSDQRKCRLEVDMD